MNLRTRIAIRAILGIPLALACYYFDQVVLGMFAAGMTAYGLVGLLFPIDEEAAAKWEEDCKKMSDGQAFWHRWLYYGKPSTPAGRKATKAVSVTMVATMFVLLMIDGVEAVAFYGSIALAIAALLGLKYILRGQPKSKTRTEI